MNSQTLEGHSLIQSLIETNESVRQLLNTGIDNGLWLVYLDNPSVTHATANFWETLGVSAKDASNRTSEWQKLVHPDDLKSRLKYFSEVAKGTSDKYDIVGRFKKNDDTTIWIRCRAIAIKDQNGKPNALMGMHTDITQEIEYQKGGDDNLTLFQDFFLLSNQLFCIGHVRGEFLRVNLAFKNILEYYPSDILGRTFESAVHPEDWPDTRKKLLSIVHGEPITKFTVRIQHKDGSYRVIEWKAIYKNELLYGSGDDITEQIRIENELQESKQIFSEVSKNVPGLILRFIANDLGETKLLYASKGVEEIPSLGKFPVLTIDIISQLIHPEDQLRVKESFDHAIKSNEIWNCEFRVIIEGVVVWLYGSGSFRTLEDASRLWNVLLVDISQRKKEERKHHRVRRMLEQTNEVARVGGWEMDLSQNKLYWSAVTKAIHKLPEDFIPKSEDAIQFYKEGKNRDRIKESLSALIKEKTPFADEFQIIDKEGNEVWVFVTGKGEWSDGRCVRMFGSIQDISERKRTEAQLQESETKFRSFVENLNDIIFTLDRNGNFKYITPNSQDILGYKMEQMIGASFGAVVHRDDLAACFHYIEKAFNNEPYRDPINYRVMHADGKWRWYAAKGRIFQSDGESLFLGVARDVTKEKSIEESLIASEKQAFDLAKSYKNILDSQNVFIIKTDMQGFYTYANEHFKYFFGFGDEVVGVNSMSTIHPDDHAKAVETVHKCLAEPNVPHEVIIRKPTRDGSMKGGRWEFRAITNANGEPIEILCVGYDISEQLENLERAQTLLKITSDQNFKLKSFSHIVSHNIRSHSANLISLAEFISETQDEEEKNNFINMLKISTQKLEETIRNLSDIINIEESTDKTKEPLRLHHEVNKALQSLNASIFQLQVEVDNNVPEDLYIHAVPTYLDSILLNMLSNAIRYRSPDRPCHIKISTERNANYIILSISDNGLGIDLSKHAHKLFGMYKTFHGNEDARGFGLYITKTQIEAMGGKIDVESEVGIGTTFKIYFREKN